MTVLKVAGIFSPKVVSYVAAILTLMLSEVRSFPEQGRWNFNLSDRYPAVRISKSSYKNSTAEIVCNSEPDAAILVTVTTSFISCSVDFFGLNYVNSSFQDPSAVECHKIASKYMVPKDSIFLISFYSSSSKHYDISVSLQIKGDYGYLSAIDWPLLPFYSTMCAVYVLYGFFWMIICFWYWRDLLRIQLWIATVIFLGLVEKAVLVAEYESINESGKSVQGAVIAAELISCLKRTLARMLVIIACLGFGITRPRLGTLMHKVTALGCIYFCLSSAEAIIRVITHKADFSLSIVIAVCLLSVTDAVVCWWIFSSLIQTIRMLILKRNAVKLSLYRHFRNILILSVIGAVIYMVWSFKTHKLEQCLTNWKDLWVDEAFWHVLFSMMLLAIIILWRPSANNQRYAYSPLQDADEPEEELVYSAYDLKKTHSGKTQKNSKTSDNDEDDHLKWVEDNIPTSLLDIELPALLESDSELNQHQVQISKMQ